ncbi:hypothetical protein PS645_04174 [Pseudomonas fluorescens]|uniref:Uncharacterized protein n=1 Tax=Pseudomonas fluorescens TaxID=294 RepID=A0A5E6VTU7_PSEFL|nr:hypothetical protein [Pseudomonas fluorescens]VVN18464.1 hypothetical protein PS645_04174 [Pseudomonas fluorescens]
MKGCLVIFASIGGFLTLIFAWLVLLTNKPNYPDRADRVDHPKFDEALCMEAAREEIYRRHYSYDDQANSKTDRWIYKTHFKFLDNDMDGLGFSMPGNYKVGNIYSKYAGYIPGIVTWGRKSTQVIIQKAPGLLTSQLAIEPTYVAIKLRCQPDRLLATNTPYNRASLFHLDRPDNDPTITINRQLGIRQVDESFDTSFMPLDKSLRNPDGSELVVQCHKSGRRHCWNSFLFRDGVWVIYRFPTEQLADWKKIHDLVLSNLESAIIR